MKYSKSFKLILLSFSLILFCNFRTLGQSGQDENSMMMDANDPDLEWGGCPDFMPQGCNIAILHGDPAAPNTDLLFRVPANSDIPKHWHHSAERMVLLSGEMQVTYDGEDTQVLKSGSYAYGPAKKPHTARCGDAGPCLLFIAFEEPVDAFASEEEE